MVLIIIINNNNNKLLLRNVLFLLPQNTLMSTFLLSYFPTFSVSEIAPQFPQKNSCFSVQIITILLAYFNYFFVPYAT